MFKKAILALTAGAMLALWACGKDDSSDNGTDPGSSPNPTTATEEGIYRPVAKLQAINNPDGSSDRWRWHGDTLVAIDNEVNCGGTEPMMTFHYQDGTLRLAGISLVRTDLRANLALNYSGSSIHSADITLADENGIERTIHVRISHNAAGKVSQADIEVADADLMALLPLAMSFAPTELPFEMPEFDPSKLSNNSIKGVLSWNGDNVSRLVAQIEADLALTVSDIPLELLQQVIGVTAANMVYTAMPDLELPLHLSITDTSDFTYEPHTYPNPLYGFIGRVDVATLSADNVRSHHSHGQMSISGQVQVPIFGAMPIDRSMAMPDTTINYMYEYDEATQLPLIRYDDNRTPMGFVY